MMFRPRVLLVDDEEATREALARVLCGKYVCETAPSVAGGLEKLRLLTFDVVIAEVHMDGVDGFVLLDWLKRERPTLPAILVSARGGIQEAVGAMKRGAFHYLTKPCDEAELVRGVDGAVAARRRCAANPTDGLGILPTQGPERANASLDARRTPIHAGMELVGSGPAMGTLLETIDMVAASSAPVLVTGESGSGKELVSRAIHARSPRCAGPFVAVNTSAIPAELLEAEVFGHVRGGFTGAAQTRKGLVTEASGGTLLLDEIGDMPLGLQAKILRVVQFGEVRPVGSDRAHHIDVRVIAATHRDVATLVREGRFREDLYFRLNVLPVVVPPLRERREDIPALALHLLAQARQRSPACPVRSIEPDALEILSAAPWPGNVRELASVIERLVVFGREESIAARHLSFLSKGAPSSPPPSPLSGLPAGAPWTLRRLTEAYTEQVLAETGGNKQRAAEILDVDLSTLYRWQRGGKSPRKRARNVAPHTDDEAGGRDTLPPGSRDTQMTRFVGG
jgi:two-component system, NtrC family, response regulator HydG